MKGLSLALVAAFLVVGCAKENASEVDQSRIYTSYSVSYDDSNHTLSALATFTFGGSTGTYLVLDHGSGVSFDGTQLSETTDIVNQALYEFSQSAQSSSVAGQSFEFVYTDVNGKTYSNSVVIPNLVGVTYSSSSVSKSSSSLVVNWGSPDPIGTDSLILSLTGAGSSGNITLSSAGSAPGSSGSYTVTSADLANTPVGTYTAQVCRTRTGVPASAPAIGGDLTTTSCTAQYPLSVVN